MVKSRPMCRKNHNSAIDEPFGPDVPTPNRRTISKSGTRKKVTWKDESVAGLGVNNSGKPELSDPAILVVRENPKFRYGRDELFNIRDSPLSQRKPDFVDINEIPPTIWDSTKWSFDRKKSDTPTENGTRPGEIPEHRRRPGDPRERLRKENDGIVLSPQRRSFNSGCFVPGREPPTSSSSSASSRPSNRPHSPPTVAPSHLEPYRESSAPPSSKFGPNSQTSSNNRRIGSGRILRDWDYGDKPDQGDVQDYGVFGRNTQRGAFGRDFDTSSNASSTVKEGKSRGRYNDRRRDQRDEEPEWFSSGPISQNDTIELRGFDESDKLCQKKKMSPSQAKRARDWYKKKSEISTGNSIAEEKGESASESTNGSEAQRDKSPPNRSSVATAGGATHVIDKKDEDRGVANKESSGGVHHHHNKQNDEDNSALFEDILKSDTILNLPGFLANGGGADGDNSGGGKSRFSQWFSAGEPYGDVRRRTSIESNEAQIKNLLSDIFEPTVTIPPPGDSDSYFAPISPAANTGGGAAVGNHSKSKVTNMMEMLHKSNKQNELKSQSQMPERIMNLVDLEAQIRQSEPQMPKHHHKSDDDMAAFNRLVTGGHAVAATTSMTSPKAPPMTLMEMLSHSQQQDEARMAAQLLGPASPAAHHHGDYNARLQQQLQNQKQSEMLGKFINAKLHAFQLDPGMQQQSRELLNRPEAQAILQGLKRGDITPQHLYQQLANPALQPRHRDMLGTILKMQGGATSASASTLGPSPRVLSPVAPSLSQQQQQQQQQLRVSPLPPNAYCVSPIMATSPNTLTVPALHQRIPSPRELQVHTQNILQRALIRKKLEEQQENYRKKQEMQQRGQSPNNNNNSNGNNGNANSAVNCHPAKSVSSPTPLAFTPTSVLRKMTAEKDEGGNKDLGNKLEKGRAVTGMKQSSVGQQSQVATQQSQQQQAMGQWNFGMSVKQPGRPIVKANNFQQQQQQQQRPQDQFFNQQQQEKLYSQLQQAQQQHHQQQQQRNKYHIGGHGYPNQQFQQLRAQHQQHARPTSTTTQQTQQPQAPPQQQQQQTQQQQMTLANQTGTVGWQQFLNQNQGRNQLGRAGLTDGDLSPTSNQLTRWFSPDLLERARGGELPSTAGLAQHALSLEEIERLTAPPVHN